MPITLAELEFFDHEKIDVSEFDCEDADLNEFLKVDCPKYKEQKLSHTKVAVYSGQAVAYLALLADSISLEITERERLVQKNVTVQHIPALKIGRLAVHRDFKGQDIGTALIKYSIGVAFRMNDDLNVGCRFLTVDAYPGSIRFYEKVGFKRSLHKTYKKRKNPTMHYDIVSGKPL